MTADDFNVIGYMMVAIAALRIADIAWPTKPLHWGVYVVELGIGLTIVLATNPLPRG